MKRTSLSSSPCSRRKSKAAGKYPWHSNVAMIKVIVTLVISALDSSVIASQVGGRHVAGDELPHDATQHIAGNKERHPEQGDRSGAVEDFVNAATSAARREDEIGLSKGITLVLCHSGMELSKVNSRREQDCISHEQCTCVSAECPETTVWVESLIKARGNDCATSCEFTGDPCPQGAADCGNMCFFHMCIGLVPLQRTLGSVRCKDTCVVQSTAQMQ